MGGNFFQKVFPHRTKMLSYVDPFLGNGTIDLPKPYAPADSWHMIKGLTGNTSPAACLPFGRLSVLGYSGGYPCGCGNNKSNSGGKIASLYPNEAKIIGLSHFQQSGTGAIGTYYNYALTSPFYGNIPDFMPKAVVKEIAHAGYYAVETENGIFSEATVSGHTVFHRYTLGRDGGIAIDFANDGLYDIRLRGTAVGTVTRLSDTELAAEVTLKGVKLSFYALCPESRGTKLFTANLDRDNTVYVTDTAVTDGDSITVQTDGTQRVGGFFVLPAGQAHIRLTVSTKTLADVIAENHADLLSFDEARKQAEDRWSDALSKIEIDTDDEREKTIFYSNFYHTLIKPNDMTGFGFFDNYGNGDFIVDLATMWDIYKTQLPLVFSFYPEISTKILNTLMRMGELIGYYPHCLMLSTNLGVESKQARLLAEHSIYDAYLRGVKADYPHLFELSLKDADRFMDEYIQDGGCELASHTLDMGEAFAAMEQLALALGYSDKAEKLHTLADGFIRAFDSDGIMRKNSWYYEGNRYNYSFRPVHDTAKRLSITDRTTIEYEAKRFFGFVEPENTESRFEGFNNETDMESPYFLHDIGRRDLLCQVIQSGMDCMFTTGRGGIPGNNDSGGLSSAYLWNVLGLFPVSGQNRVILGRPRYKKSILHLSSGKDLVIENHGSTYVELNGKPIANYELTVTELMNGGNL